MIYLFIHQNFPGQYRYVVRHLADDPANQVYFITQPNQNWMQNINKVVYQNDKPSKLSCHQLSVDFDLSVRTGMKVAAECRKLRDQGIIPDIIIGHSGWGETLFVKDIFPDVPILAYFEFYYHSSNVDVGFDPEFPSMPGDSFRLRTKNAINLLSFDSADWGSTPTRWQHSLHPPEMRPRISVLHEGVDTSVAKPNPSAWIQLALGDIVLTGQDEVVTYVARNLEPYRGFHIFMRAAAEIQRRRPKAHIVVVGADGVSYGAPAPKGTTYRKLMLQEVGQRLDMSRIHFLGQIPYEFHLNLLQISSAHIYLTFPFVLSWSFLEAMASGCAIIGSDTPPVMEVLQDGVNGLAVDFFSPTAVAERVDEILDHPTRMAHLRHAARATAVRDYDLHTKALPRWTRLMNDLMAGRKPLQFAA